MKKEFVPYQFAIELKHLGFDEPCFGYYLCKNTALGVYLEITTEWIDLLPYDSASCKAPTFSQAKKFFREKFKLDGYAHSYKKHWHFTIIERHEDSSFENLTMYDEELYGGVLKGEGLVYLSHEEAELACIVRLIEIVKKQINQQP